MKSSLTVLFLLCATCAIGQVVNTKVLIDDGTGHKLTQMVQSLSGTSKTIKWPGTNGTSGYVLSTNGANPAILSWTSVLSATDAIITDPATIGRNTIFPIADVEPLVILSFDPPTSDAFSYTENHGGTGTLEFEIGPHGTVNMSARTGDILDIGGTVAIPSTGILNQAHGGTGFGTYSTGDLLYASGTNVLSKRAIGSTGNILTVSGGVPVWAAPASSGVTSITGTANQVLANGTTGSAQTGAVTLTTPQDIGTTSSPSFYDVNVANNLNTIDVNSESYVESGGPGLGQNGQFFIVNTSGNHYGDITILSLSGNRTWYMPDADGTVALTSDIPSSGSYIQNQTSSQSPGAFNITNSTTGTVANIASTYTGGTATALTVNSTGNNGSPNQGLTINVTNAGAGGANDIVGTATNWKITSAGALTLGSALTTANGGTGLATPGTSGNVLTSNGTIWTSAVPTTSFTVAQTIDIEGIAGTSTDALTLENLTAATSSVAQWSPRDHYIGKLWNSASQLSDWITENQTNISGGSQFTISQSTNGGTYLPEFSIKIDNSGLAPTFTLGGRNSSTNGAGAIINMGILPTTTIAGGDATINGQSANGSNQFGGNFIIQVGLGTGNKNGQSFIVRSSHNGAGASTLNTATQMLALTPSGSASTNPTVTATFGKSSAITGILNVCQSGAGNAACGTGTLVAGVATISTAAVKTGDLIFITPTSNNAADGTLSIGVITNVTSFTVVSSNGASVATFNWLIIRPN